MTLPLHLVYITPLHLILKVLGKGNPVHEKLLTEEFMMDEEKSSWRQVLEIGFG